MQPLRIDEDGGAAGVAKALSYCATDSSEPEIGRGARDSNFHGKTVTQRRRGNTLGRGKKASDAQRKILRKATCPAAKGFKNLARAAVDGPRPPVNARSIGWTGGDAAPSVSCHRYWQPICPGKALLPDKDRVRISVIARVRPLTPRDVREDKCGNSGAAKQQSYDLHGKVPLAVWKRHWLSVGLGCLAQSLAERDEELSGWLCSPL